MSPGRDSRSLLDALAALHPQKIDLDLGRIRRLMAALNHPERRLPPVIHVAGTNGKGSVIAFLRALFERAGARVHVYTSPHLRRFHERIALAGDPGAAPIKEGALAGLLEECRRANRGQPITFFEITTAAAFLAFARARADFLLLETGLGGRLDATNLVARPLLTVITPVSLDHQEFLGRSLPAIAREKAGIIKAGCPLLCAAQPRTARAAIMRAAAEKGAPVFLENRDWRVRDGGDHFTYCARGVRLRLPRPALAGPHQIGNAGLALAAFLRAQPAEPDPARMAQALRSVVWPGRLQRLTGGPLLRPVPSGVEVWLDGGHNPAAGVALARACAGMNAADPKPLHLICAMRAVKDAGGFLAPFKGLADCVHALRFEDRAAAMKPEDIRRAARAAGLASRLAAGPAEALAAIRPPARVLICGSLLLAGDVLRENA